MSETSKAYYFTDREIELIVEALDLAANAIADIDDPNNYEQDDLDEIEATADAMTTLSMRLS